jgi:N-acetylglucosaminyldiphosphoundecaprenol N-acetyl-beta-D-mannosaminyltransferase
MSENKVILFNLPFWKINTEKLVNLMFKQKYNIYFCTLNEIVMAEQDLEFRKKLLKPNTILVTDGIPLVWLMKHKTGFGERIYGPDFLKNVLFDNKRKINNIFVGDKKNNKYFKKFGNYIIMPMKERFNRGDYKNLLEKIDKTNGKIVWLGLGAKKQIEVADELKKRGIKKVIITVGAAFDYLSGNKKQAPKILRNSGLEWLYRLLTEPKRLWPRYSQIIKFLVNKIRVNGFNFLNHI